FSNFILLKKTLDRLPRNGHIIVDFSDSQLVDHTVMENLHRYMEDYNLGGGHFEITGLEHHEKFSSHAMAARKKTMELV
ncbi:MAG: SulP family inorganic anion transporter, partial [Bacteroidota bacterium]